MPGAEIGPQRRPEYRDIWEAGLQKGAQKEKATLEIEDVSPMLKELTKDDDKMEIDEDEHSKVQDIKKQIQR